MAKNNKLNSWSLGLLRIVLGVIFTFHGYTKLFAEGGFTGIVSVFTAIGIPVPVYSAFLVSVVELVGGLFLLFGLVTKWSAAILFVEMLVALFKVHIKNGFLVGTGGYEFVLLLLATLLVVWVNGAGSYSLGKKWFKNKSWH